MDVGLIKELILTLPVLFFSVILHECGHGIIAYKCGDPTAKMMGRITLNPIPHIDLLGTIILPIVMAISTSGHAWLGWAKPVPVNYFNLRHPKRDMIWVSIGGVGVNIILAVVGIIVLFIVSHLSFPIERLPVLIVIYKLLLNLVLINVILATFNLIPIPPLDGSRIVLGLLPTPLAEKYAKIEPFGIIIMFGLLFLGVFNTIFEYVLLLLFIVFPFLLYIYRILQSF
jgi:Zn-dependent protease